VKVGLELAKKKIEPIIEIHDVFMGSFANFEVLGVKEVYTFFFTSCLFESSF
jgi:hypothetical protein